MTTLRDDWRKAKAHCDSTGAKVSEICRDQDFGPKLDKFTAADEAYKKNKDADKADGLRDAAQKSIALAHHAGVVYGKALAKALQHYEGTEKEMLGLDALLNRGLTPIMKHLHAAANFYK